MIYDICLYTLLRYEYTLASYTCIHTYTNTDIHNFLRLKSLLKCYCIMLI